MWTAINQHSHVIAFWVMWSSLTCNICYIWISLLSKCYRQAKAEIMILSKFSTNYKTVRSMVKSKWQSQRNFNPTGNTSFAWYKHLWVCWSAKHKTFPAIFTLALKGIFLLVVSRGPSIYQTAVRALEWQEVAPGAEERMSPAVFKNANRVDAMLQQQKNVWMTAKFVGLAKHVGEHLLNGIALYEDELTESK